MPAGMCLAPHKESLGSCVLVADSPHSLLRPTVVVERPY